MELNQTDMAFANDWTDEKYVNFMKWVASKHWDQIEEAFEILADDYEQKMEEKKTKT